MITQRISAAQGLSSSPAGDGLEMKAVPKACLAAPQACFVLQGSPGLLQQPGFPAVDCGGQCH